MNVLVVDDLGTIRTIIARTLNKLGVEHVDLACNGREAMELLQEQQYHLIVTDFIMPYFDGIQVAMAARELGCRGPIILQTTDGQKAQMLRAFKCGVTDYILKPFNTESLYDRLEDHVFAAAMVETEDIRKLPTKATEAQTEN